MEELTEDIISEAYSGIISNGEILPQEPLFLNQDSEEDDEGEIDDIIVLHMDIRQPLSTLRSILEQRVGVPLKNFDFWLQNAQMLESHKNLVDQCVQGEGIVQINVQVITMTRRINIVDVLKPTEEILSNNITINNNNITKKVVEENEIIEETENSNDKTNTEIETSAAEENGEDSSNSEDKIIKWCADKKFRNEQIRLGIPSNPLEWSIPMVRHWLQWAVRQFNLTHIKLQDWTITGRDLCSIQIQDFKKKVPNDPNDIFWTHLELLRNCKMVAIIQKNDMKDSFMEEESKYITNEPQTFRKIVKSTKNTNRATKNFDEILNNFPSHVSYEYPSGNRTGNSGQIQLWQFLLDILTDRSCRHIIHWMDGNGEFKLSDPERVAQLWGERKNKPTMNYEKLSRALRYYYDGDMISKVHGKRFVYQFVCDLRQLIGYSAEELANLVNENPVDQNTNSYSYS